MGELVLAAKVTHVPSMMICEKPGPHYGRRDAAIDGHRELGRRMRALGIDTMVVFDTHWLVNTGYHVNSCDRYRGVYSSNEFPHFINDLHYDIPGNSALGDAVAANATKLGVKMLSHHVASLDLEYGTLVPVHYMDPDNEIRVVSIAAWCPWHLHEDSRVVGEAVAKAVAESSSRVALLASGSLSHRIHDNRDAEAGMFTISNELYRQTDLAVLELWRQGRFDEFVPMLPEYARSCHGEGLMHDTAMLLGALGWDRYRGKIEIITEYFCSSGTGQVNAVFPIQ
ncbi:MAG: 3,4-dihydroxyphenylacetate 2,3-dioxygenase [Steroidobacteraceae bacterium]